MYAAQSWARQRRVITRLECGALRDLGMRVESLDRVADLAVQNPYPNSRPLDRAALRAMLQRAYEGEPPLWSTRQCSFHFWSFVESTVIFQAIAKFNLPQ